MRDEELQIQIELARIRAEAARQQKGYRPRRPDRPDSDDVSVRLWEWGATLGCRLVTGGYRMRREQGLRWLGTLMIDTGTTLRQKARAIVKAPPCA